MATKQQEMLMMQAGEGLAKVGDGEFVFILRAQDKFAPTVVEHWADRVQAAKGAATPKVREARALAHQMRAWQELNTSKVPD